MLFNWVQPLFNRYAQRCAKGVTRAGNNTDSVGNPHWVFLAIITLNDWISIMGFIIIMRI